MKVLEVAKSGGGRRASEVFNAPADSLVTVLGTFHFYAGAYRTLVRLSLGMGLVLIALILFCCLVVATASPRDRFFTASVNGRVSPLLPLDTPNTSVADVASQVSAALRNALTFGYLDYEQRKAENLSAFTPHAFKKTQDAILGSGGIEKMRSSLSVYRAEPVENQGAVLLNAGVNTYFTFQWILQIPVRVSIESDLEKGKVASTVWIFRVLVERTADVDVRSGFIISDILDAQPLSGGQEVSR